MQKIMQHCCYRNNMRMQKIEKVFKNNSKRINKLRCGKENCKFC